MLEDALKAVIKKTQTFIIIILILCGITALVTYNITKSIYQVDLPPLPPPEIVIIKDTIKIPPIQGQGILGTATVAVPVYKPSSDSSGIVTVDSNKIKITVADFDSTVHFNRSLAFKDTSFFTHDSLRLKIRYFFPPINRFSIEPTLSRSIVIYSEYKPQYFEPSESFWDKLTIGVGIGYGTPLDEISIKPVVFVGLMYRVKISF